MITLAEKLLNQSGPMACLIYVDTDIPPTDPASAGSLPGEGVSTVPVIVADNVAESFFAEWPVEEFDLRRDLGDLTPRLADSFVEMGRPSRICSATEGVSSSAHLPGRWGWRVYAADRDGLEDHLARGSDSGTRYRAIYDRLAASGLVDAAAVARALDASDPYAAGLGLGPQGAACLTAAGIAREFDLLRDPDASGRGHGRLGWLAHAGLVIDDGDRVGGLVATADIPLGRDGRLLLPPLVDLHTEQVGFRTGGDPDRAMGEYRKLVVSLLFPALLGLAYLNCAGVTLRPRESGRGPVRSYTLDLGAVTRPTRN